MKYTIVRDMKVVLLAGLVTLLVPNAMYSMDGNYGWWGTAAKGIAGLAALGGAGYGGYHYGHDKGVKNNQKKTDAAARTEDAKITKALMIMELALKNIVHTQDLEVYARGTYGYTVQPMTTLQKHMCDMGQRVIDIGLSLTSDQHREQHKTVSDLLNQVRMRIGKLNPAVFAHEVQVAQELETTRKLEKIKIEHQAKLQQEIRAQQARTYQLVQEEQTTKIEANKRVAEAHATIAAQAKLVETTLQNSAIVASVCEKLPEAIEATGREQALEVSSAIHELKKETGKKLDEFGSRIEHGNTQTATTIADKVCKVAQDQTNLLASHMNTTTTRLGDQMGNVEKKVTNKINELEDKVGENTNQLTKQSADVTSIKGEIGAIKRSMQDLETKRSDVKSASASSTF